MWWRRSQSSRTALLALKVVVPVRIRKACHAQVTLRFDHGPSLAVEKTPAMRTRAPFPPRTTHATSERRRLAPLSHRQARNVRRLPPAEPPYRTIPRALTLTTSGSGGVLGLDVSEACGRAVRLVAHVRRVEHDAPCVKSTTARPQPSPRAAGTAPSRTPNRAGYGLRNTSFFCMTRQKMGTRRPEEQPLSRPRPRMRTETLY